MVFYLLLISEFLLSIVIGTVIIRMLLYITYRNRIFDMPEGRKVHSIPVPRLGGMAFIPTIVIEIALGIGVIYHAGILGYEGPGVPMLIKMANLLAASMILYVAGIMDDLSGLGYKAKFLLQLIAATMLVSSGIWLNNLYGLFGIYEIPAWAGIPLTLLIFVGVTNALNMIDGIDGLASGISIITLGLLSFIYIREHRFLYSTVALTMTGAVVAFWLHNIFGSAEKHTKLYMGDTGSMTLGLVICALTISLCTFTGRNGVGTNGKYLAIVFSSLLIPMMDVARLFLLRLRLHRSPFMPDTNHIHHMLMRCGLTARRSLALLLSLDVVIVALTAIMTRFCGLTVIFIVDCALYALVVLIISRQMKTNYVPKELY